MFTNECFRAYKDDTKIRDGSGVFPAIAIHVLLRGRHGRVIPLSERRFRVSPGRFHISRARNKVEFARIGRALVVNRGVLVHDFTPPVGDICHVQALMTIIRSFLVARRFLTDVGGEGAL